MISTAKQNASPTKGTQVGIPSFSKQTWLGEEVAVEAEVVRRILVALQLLALQDLEELYHHQAADGCRRGGDGRDDFPGDHLDLVTRRLLNPDI